MRPHTHRRRAASPRLRFAVLGSGSRGNAALIESGNTCVMLDCGFSVRETTARLARFGRAPDDIDAILVTHEHSDHANGVAGFARRHGIPVYLTTGTLNAIAGDVQGCTSAAEDRMSKAATRTAVNGELASVAVNEISLHEPFAIGDLQINPFPVPHDAREPVQFVFGNGDVRLGYLTDLGSSTVHVEKMLGGCQALVLESNHDRDMLKNGTYPPSLKARIAGSHGHLSNDQAADLLGRLGFGWLRHIVAAHLSEHNNHPDLACAALARALDCTPDWVQVADQDEGLGWRDVVRD